jgi:hypothetical protein
MEGIDLAPLHILFQQVLQHIILRGCCGKNHIVENISSFDLKLAPTSHKRGYSMIIPHRVRGI